MTELSMKTLTTLLATVEELKSSVHELKDKTALLERRNSALESIIAVLQVTSGAKFSRFSKLPAELQRAIWTEACLTPQLHILSKMRLSRSQTHKIMLACKEAKQVVEGLKLDYFCLGYMTRTQFGTNAGRGTVKNFVDFKRDTFWIKHDQLSIDFPEDVEWFCGRCEFKFRRPYESCGISCTFTGFEPGKYTKEPWSMGRLAINLSAWDDQGRNFDSCRFISTYRPMELLLVVGDYAAMETCRNVKFEAPSMSPLQMQHLMTQVLNLPDTKGLRILEKGYTWPAVERIMADRMIEVKNNRERARRDVVASGETTLEEIDNEQFWDWERLESLEYWKIPNIRFVEARSMDSDWIYPPIIEDDQVTEHDRVSASRYVERSKHLAAMRMNETKPVDLRIPLQAAREGTDSRIFALRGNTGSSGQHIDS